MIALAELKKHLKVDEDQTNEDALIKGYEEAAVAIMESETGCYFGPVAQISEVVSGNGWGPIYLRGEPVTDDEYDPFALERRESQGVEFGAVVATDYEIDGRALYPLAWWTPAQRNLRATYTAGYAENEEPQDIRQAVRELVTKMYEHRAPMVVGTIVAELPYSVQQVIRAWRKVVV
jgi:hypothetical protein